MRTVVLGLSIMFACGHDPDGPTSTMNPLPDAAVGCVPQCGTRECGLDPVCGMPCGTCSSGLCTGAGKCEMTSECTPKTCSQLGAECGFIDDGCGHALNCGMCSGNEVCGAVQINKCDPGQCTPRTCLSVGAECGTIDDGCGNPIDCGMCPSNELCGIAQPNVCSPPPATWLSVSTGAFHTCGVKNDGTLWCWGRNNAGQLGLGSTGGTVMTPQRVGVSFGWTEVAAGGFHTCGINYDHLYCWGENSTNQLGDGSTSDAAAPRLIEGAKTWSRVVAGWNTSCAHSGDLHCWGNNDYQALSSMLGPVETPRYTGDFYTNAVLGGGHACYLRDGVTGQYLSCGGLNSSGQLGINSSAQSAPRTSVGGSPQEWSRIFAGGAHSCAFANVGTAFCWGSNQYGQLGNPGASQIIPDYVDGFTDWKEMGLGDAHTCGVKQNGNLYCWGLNDTGQVGDGTTTNRAQPKLIGSMFKSVSGGYAHTCALDTNSRLWCWGDNTYDQLGTGGASATSPTAVP